MLPFSYLVIGVNPVSNESNVELSTKITVTFAKHIDPETLNANTVRLRKVNGDFVEYSGRYHNVSKTYELTPNAPLSPNTQYQTMILGGVEGVISIDGNYIPTSKTYEFVTVQKEGTLEIESLELKQDYLFISAEWALPNALVEGEEIYFNVKLSSSNNPTAAHIWPKNTLEGKTTSLNMTIPYKVEADTGYYVHVQGVSENKETNWLTKEIYIENPNVPSTPSPAPSTGGEPTQETPSFGQLAIVDHFPKTGELQKPAEIAVVFSESIDSTPFGADQGDVNSLFYVVKAPYKQQLSLLDMRGLYGPNNGIKGSVSVDSETDSLLIFTPLTGAEAFEEGKEYTVIVSSKITGTDSLALGYTYTFGFTGTPANLHGDLVQIQETHSKYGLSFSTRFIQSLMRKHSRYAVDIWVESATYDDALMQDGGAPYFIHEYVNTQVLIDSLLNGGASAASAAGNESIKLGDLSVSKEAGDSSSESLSSIIEALGKQLKMWTDLIHGHTNRGYAKPVSAVKGESVSPYPDYLTRATLKDFDK